jgi:DNA-binding transcriptional regulator YiaG
MCDVIREEEEKKVKKFLKKWQSSTKLFNCQKIKLLRKSTPEQETFARKYHTTKRAHERPEDANKSGRC